MPSAQLFHLGDWLVIAVYLVRLKGTRELITDVMVPFWKYPILTNATIIGILIMWVLIQGFGRKKR